MNNIFVKLNSSKTAVDVDVAWCGDAAVALYWEKLQTLLLLGPDGSSTKYTYDGKHYWFSFLKK